MHIANFWFCLYKPARFLGDDFYAAPEHGTQSFFLDSESISCNCAWEPRMVQDSRSASALNLSCLAAFSDLSRRSGRVSSKLIVDVSSIATTRGGGTRLAAPGAARSDD